MEQNAALEFQCALCVNMAPGNARSASRSGKKSTSSGSPFFQMIKLGFAVSIGSFLALMIFIAIAAGIFVGGFLLVKREQKKPKEEQNMTLKVVGYLLMGLAMIIGLGFGAPVFFSLLGAE